MKKVKITETKNSVDVSFEGQSADLKEVLSSHDFSSKFTFRWKQWISTAVIIAIDIWLYDHYISDDFKRYHFVIMGLANLIWLGSLLERRRLELEFKLNALNENKFKNLMETILKANLYSKGKLHEKDLDKYKTDDVSNEFFDTNFPVPVYSCDTNYFAFFPYFIMMLDDAKDKVTFIEYPDAVNTLGNTEIVAHQANVPPDAEVVGTTWEKANRNGERDRRYKDNVQLATVRCFFLEFAPKASIFFFDRRVTVALNTLSLYSKATKLAPTKNEAPVAMSNDVKQTQVKPVIAKKEEPKKVSGLHKLRSATKAPSPPDDSCSTELIVKLSIAVAYADGEISFDELQAITGYLTHTCGEGSRKLIEMYNNDVCVAIKYDDLKSIFQKPSYINLPDSKKFAAFTLAMFVGSIDDDLTESEEKMILAVADMLNCSHLLEEIEETVADSLKSA